MSDYEKDRIIEIEIFIRLYYKYSKSLDLDLKDVLMDYFKYKTIPHIIAFQQRMKNIMDKQTNVFLENLINDRIEKGEEFIHPSDLTIKLGEENLKNKVFIDSWSEKSKIDKIERKKRLEK